MTASAQDKFKKVGRSTATTLSSPGYTIGDVSITVGSTSNWPTSTGVTFAVDTVDGAGVQIAGTYNIFKGVVTSATQISSLSYVGGDANRDYTAGATTRVYIDIDYSRHNEMIDGILVEHKQTGLHSDIHADSLAVSGTSALGAVTATSLTLAGTATAEGWSPLGATPDTVTANGNNSFTLVFNGNDLTDTLTSGMRFRAARTVAAPNTAFSLDGVNDYYTKTSPNKLSFTNNFVVSAWVYITGYQLGAIGGCYNGTSGFTLRVNLDGTVSLTGYNAGAANFKRVSSYQSIPTNRWVHVAAQLDMTSSTISPTVNYVMIDGVDVPAVQTQGGTNPTALIQAGAIEIGWQADSGFLPGYIDQFAIYSAKVTQATVLASINRALTGSETNLASAYSNGSVNDLNTTTPNNLTATNGATTANISPFGSGGSSTTLEYGIIMSRSFSTDTTVVVQVPNACQLPTTGGLDTVDYSTHNTPYGFPRQRGKWAVYVLYVTDPSTVAAATSYALTTGAARIAAPIGDWITSYKTQAYSDRSTTPTQGVSSTLSTTTTTEVNFELTHHAALSLTGGGALNILHSYPIMVSGVWIKVTTANTLWYLLVKADATGGNMSLQMSGCRGFIRLENALL